MACIGAVPCGTSPDAKASALVEWIRDLVKTIGLADLWSSKDIDQALCAQLAEDVLGYMGRPVNQYRPVFSKQEIHDMFVEALLPTDH